MLEKRPEPTVPIETMRGSFSNHISDSNNRRIMFSAPFGAGKSLFLDEFFAENGKFRRVNLNPVDYSVSSNEDIIEIIKYDILYELVSNFSEQIQLEKEDFEPIILAQVFAKDRMKIFPLLKLFTSIVFPSSEALVDAAEEIVKTKDAFDDFSSEMKLDEEKIIIKYLAHHRFKKGSIREDDEITTMIKDFISRIKENSANQEIVLVIDDLDRLDPEHVFRLFNVFTAHHDSRTEKNKFNFDRIIFVCDIENIRHMFHHKFGQNVDFAGYIDKFFSKEIFEFDLKRLLKEKAAYYLSKHAALFLSQCETDYIPQHIIQKYWSPSDKSRFKSVLISILFDLIDFDIIKIRNFEKFKGIAIPSYTFKSEGGMEHHAYDFEFLVLVCNLRLFFPSINDLLNALKVLSFNFIEDNSPRDEEKRRQSTSDYLMSYSARFLINDKKFPLNTSHSEEINIFSYDKQGKEVELSVVFDGENIVGFKGVFNENSPPESMRDQVRPDHYHYMTLALHKVIERRFIS